MRQIDDTGKFRLVGAGPLRTGRLQAVVVGEGIYQTYALPEQGTVRIGRLLSSDIHIDEDSISRFHAKLHLGPPLEIEDLGSTNGVMVAGQLVKPGKPAELAIGEPVRLGAVTLVVQTAK